jgi:hypothetical protein
MNEARRHTQFYKVLSRFNGKEVRIHITEHSGDTTEIITNIDSVKDTGTSIVIVHNVQTPTKPTIVRTYQCLTIRATMFVRATIRMNGMCILLGQNVKGKRLRLKIEPLA